jgi:hypothetical protein
MNAHFIWKYPVTGTKKEIISFSVLLPQEHRQTVLRAGRQLWLEPGLDQTPVYLFFHVSVAPLSVFHFIIYHVSGLVAKFHIVIIDILNYLS